MTSHGWNPPNEIEGRPRRTAAQYPIRTFHGSVACMNVQNSTHGFRAAGRRITAGFARETLAAGTLPPLGREEQRRASVGARAQLSVRLARAAGGGARGRRRAGGV